MISKQFQETINKSMTDVRNYKQETTTTQTAQETTIAQTPQQSTTTTTTTPQETTTPEPESAKGDHKETQELTQLGFCKANSVDWFFHQVIIRGIFGWFSLKLLTYYIYTELYNRSLTVEQKLEIQLKFLSFDWYLWIYQFVFTLLYIFFGGMNPVQLFFRSIRIRWDALVEKDDRYPTALMVILLVVVFISCFLDL